MLTAETFGAWLLKANPTNGEIVDRLRHRRQEPVTDWCVARNRRAAMIEPGQRVFLWVSGDGRQVEPGVWGVGHTTGACVEKEPQGSGDGPTTYVVPLAVRLLDAPVPRTLLREDPRLSPIEVLRVPVGSNPSYLTREQAAALLELLDGVATA